MPDSLRGTGCLIFSSYTYKDRANMSCRLHRGVSSNRLVWRMIRTLSSVQYDVPCFFLILFMSTRFETPHRDVGCMTGAACLNGDSP